MSSSTCDEDATAAEVGRDGALSRWALGSLVLVALAASEITGAGTVASLPVAFITVTLSAICSLESLNPLPANMKPPRRIRSGRDLLDFMQLWLHMLSTLSAAATCARIASATVDYMSEGHSRIWLFGYESQSLGKASLGEAWPDVLGLTVIIVVSAMFMLGLEYSTWFCVLLIICVTGSIGFFALVGSLHSDVTFWTHDRFLPSGWQGLLTTAAMCSFGFVDVFPKQNVRYRCARSTAYILVPLASYCTVAIVFTLMTHFRELTENSVPLVRVFEARDVAWARPAMAAFSIVVVCLALTELCPRVYANVVTLAGHEWRVLAKSLAYENETTGSAVLAVFTAGSLSAILAFACPLSYLIRLLNIGPLLAHILQATAIIYDRYQPDTDVEDFPVYTDVGYSRLNKTGGSSTSGVGKTSKVKKEVVPEPSAVKGLKFGLWFLPRAVRSTTHSFLQDSTSDAAGKGKNRGQSEERECLLMGEYSPEYVRPLERQESNLDLELGSDEESECDVMVRGQEIEKEEDSSTDIDAIVEEYKERIKVATTLTSSYAGSTMRLPSLASGRRVLVCVWLLNIAALLLGGGALFLVGPLCWSAISVMVVLCAVIAYQPQRPKVTTPCSGGDVKNIEKEYRIALVPWIPAFAVAFNSLLAAAVLPEVWIGVILWIGAGLILFCRCDCWWCDCCDVSSVTSRRERIRLRGPSSRGGSVVSTLVPNNYPGNSPRLSHVDTILIAR